MVDNVESSFIWDAEREIANMARHGVDFSTAAMAFKDPHRKIYVDSKHSQKEERYFCIGKVEGKVLTVRFIYRHHKVRIFGAGYWRKGKGYYDKKDSES